MSVVDFFVFNAAERGVMKDMGIVRASVLNERCQACQSKNVIEIHCHTTNPLQRTIHQFCLKCIDSISKNEWRCPVHINPENEGHVELCSICMEPKRDTFDWHGFTTKTPHILCETCFLSVLGGETKKCPLCRDCFKQEERPVHLAPQAALAAQAPVTIPSATMALNQTSNIQSLRALNVLLSDQVHRGQLLPGQKNEIMIICQRYCTLFGVDTISIETALQRIGISRNLISNILGVFF